MNMALAV